MGCGCGGETTMSDEIGTDQWVEMAYSGQNGNPLTFKGYLRREYRVSAYPDGSVKQTGTITRRSGGPAGTVLVHPDDVAKLQRLVDRGALLFTRPSAPPVSAAVYRPTGNIDATPEAIALAEENGVNLADVTGSGPDGVITADDVSGAISGQDDEAVILGDDLTAINGIGNKTAVKLVNAGITTYVQLIEADSEDLAEKIGANVSVLRSWQVDARKAGEARKANEARKE